MVIRKVSIDDVEILIRLRMDYLIEDRGVISPEDSAKIKAQLKDYFQEHISDGTFIGAVAENKGELLSAAYLAISEKPANPAFITGKTGTLKKQERATLKEYIQNSLSVLDTRVWQV